jgi:hypothetical protein
MHAPAFLQRPERLADGAPWGQREHGAVSGEQCIHARASYGTQGGLSRPWLPQHPKDVSRGDDTLHPPHPVDLLDDARTMDAGGQQGNGCLYREGKGL